ncbi:MAG: hypothetical protein AUJ92_06340 [Armatimonadetes bacterium CG2_30_59_28]|nr:DUF433 domain-containing protein [Armatimonadota bacterium]OIO96321.1 MAG: hypothetical protein AUJ92_06340 [Armatimonadetes bacterium CG2_30_59_28]PIU65259.1 MAG: hypothetical protein COS85_09475 [Armatimonadetes bacterium CG07_land_8_20_14_0_80_59_28]PIY39821.1 MAG: hypothetical protein COZ05_18685 [Armatimonadetes bacterium CG_4_10_14_3_um_filter_59_10]
MLLDDYFDFLSPDDIRLKGHRVGIEDVLSYYLQGYMVEEIAVHLPSLSLEEIHATIVYYLRNRHDVDAYMGRVLDRCTLRYQEWAAQPSPLVDRVRALREHGNTPSAVAA